MGINKSNWKKIIKNMKKLKKKKNKKVEYIMISIQIMKKKMELSMMKKRWKKSSTSWSSYTKNWV